MFYRDDSGFDHGSSRKELVNYLSLFPVTGFILVCCLHLCLKGIFSDNSGGMTFCPALYCWVMFERAFFFLASSSCFLRCSSCSFRSFSSCWQHIRCGFKTVKEPCPSEHNTRELSYYPQADAVVCDAPQAWPASPSPSLLGPSAALPSQRDVSPAGHADGTVSGAVSVTSQLSTRVGRTILLTRAMSSSSSFFL